MDGLMAKSVFAVAIVCALAAGPANAQGHTPISNMKTAPNKTVVTGLLQSYEAAADGYGGDVEIEVVGNESLAPSADFIKPKAGKVLHAFCPEFDERTLASLKGRLVKVDLTFIGGPSGGRAVVQSLKAAAARK
jgi:hypothetical protein